MKIIKPFDFCPCGSRKMYANCCFEKDNNVSFYAVMNTLKEKGRNPEPNYADSK
jgi:hypothetical protein